MTVGDPRQHLPPVAKLAWAGLPAFGHCSASAHTPCTLPTPSHYPASYALHMTPYNLKTLTKEGHGRLLAAETCPTGCAWDTLDGGATPAAPLASVSSHAAGQAWAGEGQGGGCSGLGMSSKAYARARRAVMGGPRGGRVPVHFLKSALDSDILRILGALTPTLSPTDPVPRAY